MGKKDQNGSLMINNDQATKNYPEMEAAYNEMEACFRQYKKANDFFWQQFFEIFVQPDSPVEPDEWISSAMDRIFDRAKPDGQIDVHKVGLEQNNDRAIVALGVMAAILKRH